MHESTLRFEHCYRLDMDAKIAPPHREHCCRDWTEPYAGGQPLDRVEYARRRIFQLESGDTKLLTFEATPQPDRRVFEEIPQPGPEAPMAAPAPTSAHEPPPKTAPAPGASASPPAESAKVATPRPGDDCTAQCSSTLDTCNRLCAAKQADCLLCGADYRSCMRRCFE